MVNRKPRTALFRRKKEGKTDYKRRLGLLKSGSLRLVVRTSSKNTNAQLVEYLPDGDKILVTANSIELKKQGWKLSGSNIPAAYLVGVLLGKKALAKKQKDAILDLGLQNTRGGTKVFAVLKGALDAGMNIPYSKEALPSEDRLNGEHISGYANAIKDDKARYEKQFSKYLKNNVKPEDFKKYLDEMKKKLQA